MNEPPVVGWCPHCGCALSTLNLDGRGFCPWGHGWVWAEYQKPKKEAKEGDEDEAMA